MFLRFRLRGKNSAGFSLIEMMIVGVIMCGMGLGAASLMTKQARDMKDSRTVGSRDALKIGLDSVTQSVLTLQVLGRSQVANLSPGNGALADCLQPPGSPPDCVAGNYDMFLFSFPGHNPSAATAVAGPSGSEVFYTQEGNRCPPAKVGTPLCPISVTASAEVVCPGGASTCPDAAQVTLHYRVETRSSATTLPQKVVDDSDRPFDMQTVFATGDRRCPDNEVMMGLDANGNLICTPPLFVDRGCTPGQYMIGISAIGVPRCAALPPLNYGEFMNLFGPAYASAEANAAAMAAAADATAAANAAAVAAAAAGASDGSGSGSASGSGDNRNPASDSTQTDAATCASRSFGVFGRQDPLPQGNQGQTFTGITPVCGANTHECEEGKPAIYLCSGGQWSRTTEPERARCLSIVAERKGHTCAGSP